MPQWNFALPETENPTSSKTGSNLWIWILAIIGLFLLLIIIILLVYCIACRSSPVINLPSKLQT